MTSWPEVFKMRERIVLAYSGGLDTSIIIPWLKENYDVRGRRRVGDIGQGDDMQAVVRQGLRDRRLQSDRRGPARGVRHRVRVPRHARRRGLRAQVPAGDVARAAPDREAPGGGRRCAKARRLAHGCTGKGNDQVRFELAYKALAPELPVIAPVARVGSRVARGRLEYAAARGIPVAAEPRPRSTAATATSGTSPTRAASWRTRPTRRSTTSGS